MRLTLHANKSIFLLSICAACGGQPEATQTSEITVTGADLVITALSSPPSFPMASAFPVAVTVCNKGDQATSRTFITLYLSEDDDIVGFRAGSGTRDAFAGWAWVAGLEAEQCETHTIDAASNVSTEGTHYVGAVIDEFNWISESDESNNITVFGPVGVGDGPDLVVTALLGPPTTDGNETTLDSTVCNQGTMPSSPVEVSFYLSEDETIIAMTQPNGDYHIGQRSVEPLQPGECHTEEAMVWPWAPADGPYFLGAIVDEMEMENELVEINNSFTGDLIGFGFLPDFVVTRLSGPASALLSDTILLENTVCNQGTMPGGNVEVNLYLSDDETITGMMINPPHLADPFLGSRYIPYLMAGECHTEATSVHLWVPIEGPYFFGAIVDEMESQPELLETNNHVIGDLIGVGNGSDLIIDALSGPKSTNGGDYVVQNTVCNQGTMPSNYVEIYFYFSADETITGMMNNPPHLADPQIGMRTVPSLFPGQCDTAETMVYPWVPEDGAYYLAAIVDEMEAEPELIESNNTLLSHLVGYGNGPDLIISALSGPPSTDGSEMTLRNTVCNQGTAPSGYVDVTFYLSEDDTITSMANNPPNTADPQIGMRSVPSLLPGECNTEDTAVWAWAPADGPHYLGAIVDEYEMEAELLEGNNTFVGGLIGYGLGADLVVTALSGPPSALPGDPVTLVNTVCNQGTTPSAGSEVFLYLSADETITGSMNGPHSVDPFLNSRFVPPLQPAECHTEATEGYTWVPQDGPYYVGAIVDEMEMEQELIESNNVFVGDLIGFGSAADLVIAALSGPPNMDGNEALLSSTVCNVGTMPSNSVEISFYLSEDETITGMMNPPPMADPHLGMRAVPSLFPGQCDTEESQVWPWAEQDGVYFLGAIVDEMEAEQELIESNNVFVGDLIGFGNGPDLVVTALSGPPSTDGSDLQLQSTVCNQGTAPSNPIEVMFYLSDDETITGMMNNPGMSDPHIGQRMVPSLLPGNCHTENTMTWPWAPEDGPYFLGALVDEMEMETELLENNNSFVGDLIGFGHGSDLVLTALEGPPSATNGAMASASNTVCNQGTMPSGNVEVYFYLTADETITTMHNNPPHVADPFLGMRMVPMLQPGACHTEDTQLNVWAPEDGVYHLGAVVDEMEMEQELIESNNSFLGSTVGIGDGPDLVVTSLSGPVSAVMGHEVLLSNMVCNQGTMPSNPTDLTLYLSEDDVITGDFFNPPPMADPHQGQRMVPSLAPGQCHSEDTPVWVWAPDGGPYFLGAIVDEMDSEPELVESNNTTVGGTIVLL